MDIAFGLDLSPDNRFMLLVILLKDELGRFPTEDEVISFINGDEETRRDILAQGKSNGS